MEGQRKSTHTARYKRLTESLASARRDAGLTQADVAGVLGKPQSYVFKIESGERRLDVVELLDILDALGTDKISFIKALGRPTRG